MKCISVILYCTLYDSVGANIRMFESQIGREKPEYLGKFIPIGMKLKTDAEERGFQSKSISYCLSFVSTTFETLDSERFNRIVFISKWIHEPGLEILNMLSSFVLRYPTTIFSFGQARDSFRLLASDV